ncbi:MAG: hypothetical protein CSA32_00570 [Desulfobulbus propionicus]|nr:MAG: hypothetical protein CSA32_00570 [Desulfobulbus propionicus]
MKKNGFFPGLSMMLLGAFMLVAGCTLNKTVSSTPAAADGPYALPPVPGFAGDIQDIAVPTELELDRRGTMAIRTESFQGGIYLYRGNVDFVSLKDYMVQSMEDNKWKLVGETSSKDIMLAFVKPSKTCMMVLTEGNVVNKTSLTFYVTIDQTAAESLNPFGEAVSQ